MKVHELIALLQQEADDVDVLVYNRYIDVFEPVSGVKVLKDWHGRIELEIKPYGAR